MAFDPDKYLQSKKTSTALATEQVPEDSVSLGDVAAMVGQGATFGFGDEILGALKAAADVALTDEELSNISNLYRQHQKEEEAKYEALKEQNPNLALGAELAGGFLIPGGLLAKGGVKALQGASTAKKIAEAAKMGAKAGALAGAGTSKSTLEDVEGLGKDILTGSIGGAVLGGSLGTAGVGLSKAIEAAPEKLKKIGPLGENIVRAFEQSKKGKGFIDPESMTRIGDESEAASKALAESSIEPARAATKEITQHFKDAGDAGARVELSPEISEGVSTLVKAAEGTRATKIPTVIDKMAYKEKKAAIKSKLSKKTIDQATYDSEIAALDANPPLKKTALTGVTEEIIEQTGKSPETAPHPLMQFSEQLKKLLSGEMTPQEALNLEKLLKGEDVPGLLPISEDVTKVVPANLLDALKTEAFKSADLALNAPGKSEQLMTKFADVRRLLGETIMNKGVLEEYAGKLINKYGAGEAALNDATTAIYNEISNHIIEKMADPSSTGDQARRTIAKLSERVTELNQKYPELKLDFNKIIDDVKAAAQDKTIRAKIMTKHGEKDSVEGVVDKLLNWTGYGGAIVAGKGTGLAQKSLKGFNNFITTASDATLMPMAKALQKTPKIDFLGHALEGALTNKSVAAKNAAIFSIMQNPEARKAISEDIGFGDSED